MALATGIGVEWPFRPAVTGMAIFWSGIFSFFHVPGTHPRDAGIVCFWKMGP